MSKEKNGKNDKKDRIKVLVVEDDQLMVFDLEEKLARMNFTVVGTAESGSEAVAKTRRTRPDIILMDIVIAGDIDGIETAERIHEIMDCPIIFISAFSDEKIMQRAKSSAPFAYLLKPFHEGELKFTIETAFFKHKYEKQLKESEERLKAQYKAIPIPTYTWQKVGDDFVLVDYNDAAIAFTRGKIMNFLGIKAGEMYADRPEIQEHFTRCFTEKIPIQAEIFQRLKTTGEEKHLAVKYAFVPPDQVLFHTEDISARKVTEEKLKTTTEQLKALASHLQDVREEERIQVARELHDELSSVLTVLKMGVVEISNRLLRHKNKKDFKDLIEKAGAMENTINESVLLVRRIITRLRPGILDDLGLIPAIDWFSEDFQESSGIRCTFSSEFEQVELNPEESTAVFRIFQEVLINIARHARATRIDILLKREDRRFKIEVRDNGRGIKNGDIRRNDSFGLMGIRERANLYGWDFSIEGITGKGTVVRLTIPLLS